MESQGDGRICMAESPVRHLGLYDTRNVRLSGPNANFLAPDNCMVSFRDVGAVTEVLLRRPVQTTGEYLSATPGRNVISCEAHTIRYSWNNAVNSAVSGKELRLATNDLPYSVATGVNGPDIKDRVILYGRGARGTATSVEGPPAPRLRRAARGAFFPFLAEPMWVDPAGTLENSRLFVEFNYTTVAVACSRNAARCMQRGPKGPPGSLRRRPCMAARTSIKRYELNLQPLCA